MTIHAHPTLNPIQRRALEIRTQSTTNAHGELVPNGRIFRISSFRQAIERLPFRENFGSSNNPTPPSAA